MGQDKPASPPFNEPNAAAYVGRRPSALRAWRLQGRGPAYVRYGRSVVYLREDLDCWLAQHRVHTMDSRPTEAV